MIRKVIKTLLLIGWMGLIFYFSSRSGIVSQTQSDLVARLLFFGRTVSETLSILIRKAAHVFLYLVLGVLSVICFREYTRKEIIAAVIFCVLYAMSDEIHQYFVPGRSAQISDILVDGISSCASIMLYKAVMKNKK